MTPAEFNKRFEELFDELVDGFHVIPKTGGNPQVGRLTLKRRLSELLQAAGEAVHKVREDADAKTETVEEVFTGGWSGDANAAGEAAGSEPSA